MPPLYTDRHALNAAESRDQGMNTMFWIGIWTLFLVHHETQDGQMSSGQTESRVVAKTVLQGASYRCLLPVGSHSLFLTLSQTAQWLPWCILKTPSDLVGGWKGVLNTFMEWLSLLLASKNWNIEKLLLETSANDMFPICLPSKECILYVYKTEVILWRFILQRFEVFSQK